MNSTITYLAAQARTDDLLRDAQHARQSQQPRRPRRIKFSLRRTRLARARRLAAA